MILSSLCGPATQIYGDNISWVSRFMPDTDVAQTAIYISLEDFFNSVALKLLLSKGELGNFEDQSVAFCASSLPVLCCV